MKKAAHLTQARMFLVVPIPFHAIESKTTNNTLHLKVISQQEKGKVRFCLVWTNQCSLVSDDKNQG